METNEVDWNEVSAILARRAKTRRQHAGYFEWDDQEQEERGVVIEFAKALKAAGQPAFSSLWSYKPDPPDCVANGEDGQKIAFEVSEFVSEEAIRRTASGERVLAHWNDGQFLRHVARILQRKDQKAFNGGPYSRIILLIYTDEDIAPETVARLFSEHLFDKPRHITESYLIRSPLPKIPPPGGMIEAFCPFWKLGFE